MVVPTTAPARTELPTVVEEPAAEAAVELVPARAWEPVVVDAAATTTNLDDIHAAILASVSVDIEPVVPVAADPQSEPEPELDLSRFLDLQADSHAADAADAGLLSLDALLDAALPEETPTIDVPAFDEPTFDERTFEPPVQATFDEPAAAAVEEPAAAAFTLTPFEAIEAALAADPHPDADAHWAAEIPELGPDVAPLLDLQPVDIVPEEPLELGGVVLPWRTHEPKAVEPAAPAAQDLIEAALSGLHADLTSEAVEPLRTPDVAVSTAHVVFRLGSRTMAIPLAAVSEIARPPKVTRLPHVPAWVLGIANLRGDIVSMLDLEGFLSGKLGKSSHEQRMLALRPAGDDVRTAVLVDSVDGIQAFEDARIARVTRGYDAEVAPYARGLYQLEDDLVVVLDADRLLQSKPMRQFEDGAGAR